jgi:hypothetical protein
MIKPVVIREINIARGVSVLLMEIGPILAVVLSEPDGGTWRFFEADKKLEAINLLESMADSQKKERKRWEEFPYITPL